MHALLRTVAFAAMSFSLISCGGSAPPRRDASAALSVAVTTAQFRDGDPTNWPGRAPGNYPVHGIDISRFQTGIDWNAARASGVNFAFIKATEGGDLVDPMFGDHWRGAGRAGVRRGAYHFWYHCRPAAEQARWYIRHVPKVVGALPPVLDMEWTPFSPTCTRRPPGATVRSEAAIFMNMLAAHYGQAPILYMTVDFYRENEMWRLSGNEFWLRSVADHPGETFAGQPWTFWQYTGTGVVPGISGEVDINVFAGTAPSWANWLGQRAL